MTVRDEESVNILIGGDVCPIGSNAVPCRTGDASSLFGPFTDELKAADLAIVNLECPLVDVDSPINKCGLVLRAESACVQGLYQCGIDVVNLANNHIMDHGWQGLHNTIHVCREAQIDVVGAGKDLSTASEVLIREIAGRRIGIAAGAEHEFSIAGKRSPGANPIDLMWLVRMIRDCRATLDLLIVLLHAGQQHYPYPTPRLQRLCRFLVEEGADAVVCQHSHCPGCIESYRGGHIVYGQGNLIFDLGANRPATWYQGYLIRLSMSPAEGITVSTIPYQQSRHKPGITRMCSDEEKDFLGKFLSRCEAVKHPANVARLWQEYCIAHKSRYFSVLRGHGRVLRYLNSRLHLSRKLYSEQAVTTLLNYMECETHVEAMLTVLSLEFNKGL